jgi:hypothetical protein
MSPNLLHLKSYLKLGSKVSGRDLGPSLGTATLRDARHRMTMKLKLRRGKEGKDRDLRRQQTD